MKKLIILAVIFLMGCSSNRVQLQPRAMNDQSVTYTRGNAQLQSQSILESEFTVLDYSSDEMIIGLALTNNSPEAILFSEKNITVDLDSSGKKQAATVYSYEQLAEEWKGQGGGDSNAVLVGRTAAGIGAGFIPFGSIAYSVGNLFYTIGSQNSESHQERVDKLTFSQLNDKYLRQQTVQPGAKYSGILKIGFDDDLEVGDTITFQLAAGEAVEEFNFICGESGNNK